MATTYYIPNANGWQSDGASTAYFLRLKVERSYDAVANRSSFTVTMQARGSANVYGGTYTVLKDGTLSGGGNTLCTFVQTDNNRSHKVTIDAAGTWYDVTSVYNPSSWSFTADHAADGSLTVAFGVNLRLTGYISGGTRYGDFFNRTASLTVNEARASSIASISSSVATQGTMAISMSRASTSFYHRATFTATGVNETSETFEASLSYPVPRRWFNSYPNEASFTLNVSVQTYADSACTVPAGSPATAQVTVLADAGMAPVINSGFVSAAANGNPTGILGFIQGVSRALITLDGTKVTYANNAVLGQYAVVCQSYGEAGTGASYLSNVLTGSGTVPFTVSVTDSRGLSASWSGTLTVMPYAPPTISGASAARCDEEGAADDEGAFFKVTATPNCSSLNGQNSVSMTVKYREAGGSWSAEQSLTGTPGTNLYNKTGNPIEQGAISSSSGNNSNSTTRVRTSGYIPVEGGKSYRVAANSAITKVFILEYGTTNNYLSKNSGWVNNPSTYALKSSSARYVRIVLTKNDGTTVPSDVSWLFVCESTKDTPFGGDLDPDKSYEIQMTATDAVGNTATVTLTLPTRKWAMKFRPDGQGVGFGMAPQRGNAIELPSGWNLFFGENALLDGLALGATVFVDTNGVALVLHGSSVSFKILFFAAGTIEMQKSTDGGSTWTTQWTK